MNLELIRSRLAAKNQIREANLTIKSAKEAMNKTILTAEESEIIKANKGQIRPVIELRKAKKEAAKRAAAAPVTTLPKASAMKPDPLATKTAPALPAPPAAVATDPAPSSARPLHGLQKAIAAAKGEKVSHSPVSPPSGLAKATAIHKTQADARKK